MSRRECGLSRHGRGRNAKVARAQPGGTVGTSSRAVTSSTRSSRGAAKGVSAGLGRSAWLRCVRLGRPQRDVCRFDGYDVSSLSSRGVRITYLSTSAESCPHGTRTLSRSAVSWTTVNFANRSDRLWTSSPRHNLWSVVGPRSLASWQPCLVRPSIRSDESPRVERHDRRLPGVGRCWVLCGSAT